MVIRPIVEQHAEETAFLWTQRDRAGMPSSQYTLRELAVLDERVEAHLDGLRVAGTAGWEICEQAMLEGEAGEAFAAASLAFGSNNPESISRVLAHACGHHSLERALISSLGWLPF